MLRMTTPSRERLTAKYDFDTAIQPMPAPASLLELGLDEAEASFLRMKLDTAMASIFQKANRRLWDDLQLEWKSFTQNSTVKQPYFMDETIEEVKKAC